MTTSMEKNKRKKKEKEKRNKKRRRQKKKKRKEKEKKREKKVSWDMFAAFHFDVLEVWVCSLSLKPALFHGHLHNKV